jgi:hypothetical protein
MSLRQGTYARLEAAGWAATVTNRRRPVLTAVHRRWSR